LTGSAIINPNLLGQVCPTPREKTRDLRELIGNSEGMHPIIPLDGSASV
jgi:hypothetical protein